MDKLTDQYIIRPVCAECLKEIWGIAKVLHTLGIEAPIHLHASCYEQMIGKRNPEFMARYTHLKDGAIKALKRARVELAEIHRGRTSIVNAIDIDRMLLRLIGEQMGIGIPLT